MGGDTYNNERNRRESIKKQSIYSHRVLNTTKNITTRVLIIVLITITIAITQDSKTVTALTNNTTNNIIITEVLYNPNSTETGREAVELFNPTEQDINIGGWAIKTENSEKDALIPEGTIIESKHYFLIADSGFSTKKDDEWPSADYEESITLANTNAGVALVDKNNNTVDAVGWGSKTEINEGLFEGTPSNYVSDGNSLSRILRNNTFIDTNNNSFDFIESKPNLKNSNFTQDNSPQIRIHIRILENNISVNSINMSDDLPQEGFQIIPEPNSNKTIFITANISSKKNLNVNCTIIGIKTKTMELKNNLYETEFNLPYYLEPANYSVLITAFDGKKLVNKTIVFHYESLIALNVDSEIVEFPSVGVGEFSSINGDFDMGTPEKPTLKNVGNIATKILIEASDLTSGTNKISVENMIFVINNSRTTFEGTLSETAKTVNLNLEPREKASLKLNIFVPEETYSGDYFGSITITSIPT